MLSLRRETDYAIHLVQYLARSKKQFMSLKDFATSSGISFWFMQKIARKLSLSSIIEAEKGVNGGYRLAVPASKLTLYKIIEVMEGKPALVSCLEKKSECAKKGTKCFWMSKMGSVNQKIVKILMKEKIVN